VWRAEGGRAWDECECGYGGRFGRGGIGWEREFNAVGKEVLERKGGGGGPQGVSRVGKEMFLGWELARRERNGERG